MPIESRCANPECGKRYSVAESMAGKSVKCKACGGTFVIAADPRATAPAPSRPSVPTATLTSVGRFVIRAKLGAGAFGTVYRAYDPQLEREVAIKVPNPGVMTDAKLAERFLREAKAAAGLRHPHIVPVFDAGKDGDQYYIASAFIAGQELADAIPETGTDFGRAARLARELAEALAHAHEQGVVHRDVKPRNVMVDKQDRVHLMDFGLAVRQEVEARLSKAGSVVGTPAYMAPEQARSEEATPASDQYAVGVVLYELLTGEVPFKGPIATVLHNVIHSEPDAPTERRAGVPKDLETICLKAMSKRSEDRYASCADLVEDLRRWHEGEPISARPLGRLERAVRFIRRRPAVAAACALGAAAASLGAITVLAVALWLRSDSARATAETARDQIESEKTAAEGARQREEDEKRKAEAARDVATAQKAQADEARGREEVAKREAERARGQSELAKTQAEQARAQAEQAKQLAEEARDQLARFKYALDIGLAHREWQANNRRRATELLEQCPDKTRGWEWGFVSRLTRIEPLQFHGHTGPVLGVAISDDGETVATVAKHEARLWQASTGREIARLQAPNPNRLNDFEVGCTTLSKFGTYVALSGKGARVIDVSTKKELTTAHQFTNETKTVTALARDGTRAAVTQAKGAVAVVELDFAKPQIDAKKTIVLKGPDAPKGADVTARALAFAGDGQRLVVGYDDGSVRVWAIAPTARELNVLRWDAGPVTSVGVSDDGRWIVASGPDGRARAWHRVNPKDVSYTAVEKFNSPFRGAAVAVSGDGKRVCGVTADGVTRVWSTVSYQEEATFPGPAAPPKAVSVAVSGSGRRVVTGYGDECPPKLWELGELASRALDHRPTKPIRTADGVASGAVAAVYVSTAGSDLRVAARWDTDDADISNALPKTANWSGVLQKQGSPIQFMTYKHFAMARDGRLAVPGRMNSQIDVYHSVPNVLRRSSAETRARAIVATTLSAEGSRLAVVSDDGSVQLFDTGTGNGRGTYSSSARRDAGDLRVALSADGDTVALNTGEVWIGTKRAPALEGFVLSTPAPRPKPSPTTTIRANPFPAVALSARGRRVAIGNSSGGVGVWDTETGKLVCRVASAPVGTDRPNPAAALNGDGNRLATGGIDGTIRVWDVDTQQELLALKADAAEVTALAWSPDGRWLVSGSASGTIRIWEGGSAKVLTAPPK